MAKFTKIPQNTFNELQLNAGILLKDFDVETGTFADSDIITATTGGIQINVKPTFEDYGDDIDNCPKNTKELKKKTDDFIWIADEKQYSTQGVFVYKYPASENENFTVENIIAHRNDVLKENVPGMFAGTYMTTGDYIKPTVEFIRFRGRQFAQTRGFWEVHNDFMGGPFVSHSFYGPDAKEIIVVEAWVYAPRFDKRQYLRQVESIIYSFEWAAK